MTPDLLVKLDDIQDLIQSEYINGNINRIDWVNLDNHILLMKEEIRKWKK